MNYLQGKRQWEPQASLGFQNGRVGIHERMFAGRAMAQGKFISYLRISTDQQGRSGLGIEAQREAVTSCLNGGRWTLVAEYVETESGRRSDAEARCCIVTRQGSGSEAGI